MTLTQMRYFYEVCKWRSITKAAASLHISQPTVSIAMADLEKESGLNLFRREGKKLSLTEDGSLLLSKITPILANLQQLDRDIKDMAQNKNLIRLAVPLQIGVQLLPTLFRDFKNLYPEIELEVVEAGGIDSLRMIENEELDLAVTNYDDSFSPNLHYRKLFKSEACFCTYPDHPLAQKKCVTLQELSREPMILLDAVPSKNYFVSIFKEKGYHPEVAYSSPSIEMVRCMVGQGLGFSVLVTRPCCDMTYDGERVVQRDIADDMPASTLIMAHLANNEPTRPTQLFMDYCRSIELTPTHA